MAEARACEFSGQQTHGEWIVGESGDAELFPLRNRGQRALPPAACEMCGRGGQRWRGTVGVGGEFKGRRGRRGRNGTYYRRLRWI